MNGAWTWRPLGELFEIGAGKTMSAAARAGANKTPFLRTSNVLWDEIDLSTVDEMAIPDHELPARLLQPGDLLVCEGGEIGRAAIWTGEIEPMSFQNHIHRLRPILPDVEPRFYVYFLQSAFTQLGLFEGAGNRTTIPNISRSRLAALDVPHPPLGEQRAIAAALARVREGVRAHERSTALARELKHAAMQALFTRGLRGEQLKETEIGPVPGSWNISTVAKAVKPFRFERSKQIPKSLYRKVGRWPVVDQGQKFFAGRVDDETKMIHSKKPLIIFGDHTRIFKYVDFEFVLGADGTKPLLAEEGFASKYLYYALENLDLPARGYNRHYTVLKGMRIAKPDLSEQYEIVSILDTINHKINLHRRKRATLADISKILLQNLMTGDIHIDDLDLSTPATVSPQPLAPFPVNTAPCGREE